MVKLKHNDRNGKAMNLKLIVLSEKNDRQDTVDSLTVDDDKRYEFYIGKLNVTPQELVSNKYPTRKCVVSPCNHRLLTKSWRTDYQDDENYAEFCLHINLKTVDFLLNDILTKRQYRDGIKLKELKYDVGPNILFPRENIVTKNYEIKLIESPTFHILDLPSSVVIKG